MEPGRLQGSSSRMSGWGRAGSELMDGTPAGANPPTGVVLLLPDFRRDVYINFEKWLPGNIKGGIETEVFPKPCTHCLIIGTTVTFINLLFK